MKKVHYLVSFIVIIMLTLAGCGDKSADGAKNSSNDKKAGFEEVDSFELEGPITNVNFSLDEDGDTLIWGETDGEIGEDKRRYAWVDGEAKELDIERYDHFASLLPSGIIFNTVWDHDKEEEKYSIVEYDPATDEETEFVVTDSDHDTYPLPSHGVYLEDPKTYVHTVTNTKFDDSETFIWDVEANEYTDVTFIQDMKKDAGVDELPSYPHFFLSSDASMIYATVLDTGVYAYDVEAGKTEKLLESDNIGPGDSYSTTLTSDDQYMTYATYEEGEDSMSVNITYQAVDVESGDTIDIGEGRALFTLSDGNVIIVDKTDDDERVVKYFDFETEELETIHTIEEKEDMEIDNVTVSLDGSTIAYGYTEKGEDDDTSYMTILSNK
ncbi:MAG TPA: hypothetical protein VK142_07895 [Bacillota bacterium]|nr:hypothetical protein [Bacillota bacterium]